LQYLLERPVDPNHSRKHGFSVLHRGIVGWGTSMQVSIVEFGGNTSETDLEWLEVADD
jgi:hypothetical protein